MFTTHWNVCETLPLNPHDSCGYVSVDVTTGMMIHIVGYETMQTETNASEIYTASMSSVGPRPMHCNM